MKIPASMRLAELTRARAVKLFNRPRVCDEDQDQKELANGAVRFLAANYRLEKRQQISSATAPRVTRTSHSLYRCRLFRLAPNTPSYLMSGTPEQFTLPCQLCERVRAAQFPIAIWTRPLQTNIGERTRRSRLLLRSECQPILVSTKSFLRCTRVVWLTFSSMSTRHSGFRVLTSIDKRKLLFRNFGTYRGPRTSATATVA